jgi:hypothetical protein
MPLYCNFKFDYYSIYNSFYYILIASPLKLPTNEYKTFFIICGMPLPLATFNHHTLAQLLSTILYI